MILFVNLIIAAATLLIVLYSRKGIKPILATYFVSLCYYGLGGYLYWGLLQDGVFLLIPWGADKVGWAATYISVSTLLIVALLFLFDRLFRRKSSPLPEFKQRLIGLGLIFWIVAVLGGAGSVYLVSSVVRYGGFNPSDSLLLVAYQFSDMLVPALLFLYVSGRHPNGSKVLIALFVIATIYFGFRYKAVLLLGPLLVVYFLNGGSAPNASKRVSAAVLIVLMVLTFGATTMARTKFEGIDFSKISESSFEQLLFGLFADSNIVFGLLSILNSFVERDIYIYAQPIVDSFMEFLPKFLYPDRQSGMYVENVLLGLIAEEAIYSATAYPFFGEYFLMLGHFGWLFGIMLLSVFIFSLYYTIQNTKTVALGKNVGIGLVAVFFGYYYFSRGYLPQFTKGFLFVILPYIGMIRNSRIARIA